MNYYERHLGDYAKDTGHLSMLEHGAYTLLLDRYYASEAGIPDAEKYRVSRATSKAERAAVDAVLREFFKLADGSWIKNRCEEEIQCARERSEEGKERAENERERQRRHRAERKKLFKQLRAYDIVPPFDTKAEELRRLLSNAQVTDLSRVTGVTGNEDKTGTDTAIHTPGTRHQYPESGKEISDSENHMDEDTGHDTCPPLGDESPPKPANPLPVLSFEQRKAGFEAFQRIKAAYPPYVRPNWLQVEVHCWNRVNSGDATWEDLEAGTARYAKYIAETGSYVTAPVNFFSAADEPWRLPWDPPKSKAQRRQDDNISESQKWLDQQEARDAQQ